MNNQSLVVQPTFNFQRIATIMLFSLLALMVLMPSLSFAASTGSGSTGGVLPTGTALDVPGAGADASWVKKFGYIIRLVIFVLCMAAVGLGISDSIFSLFRVINDGRQTGEWGPAMKTVGIIMAGIIFAIVLFGILNEFVFSAIEKFFT